MVTITTVKIKGQDFNVTVENDSSFNVHDDEQSIKVIVVSNGDEKYKFSPNVTDEELIIMCSNIK